MHIRLWCLLLGCISISACAVTGDKENEGPASYYQPAGWKNVEDTLKADNFDSYQSTITKLVQEHRFIINTDNAASEIELVAPAEFKPNGAECNTGKPLGIVILAHGLSDTAFAMHDLAAGLAEHCYLSRTLLLPGHGTVPGDLLAVNHDDWLNTVRTAAQQAASENDNVVFIGFSLGAALGLSLALESGSPVDALVSISPAFFLRAWKYARWAPWAYRLRLLPWIDRELPDNRFRYEAIPTRGVAETVRAIRRARQRVSLSEDGVKTPWMLLQSLDDAVTVPAQNLEFFLNNATHENSQALVFQSPFSEAIKTDDTRIKILPGNDEATRVLGLTHVAVQVSPENSHYGPNGDYRNCGSTGGREDADVALCEAAEEGEFNYALWNKPENAEGVPQARSAFNPRFEETVDAVAEFISASLKDTLHTAD